ncbi:hypothetical protein Syun_003655 [Stephania yunnanensis]|uniref:Uncharacterized protein n=1 Tax=Stephania yunnanensis TaxID=152371 RepID=A0AAP0L314_9MAGN
MKHSFHFNLRTKKNCSLNPVTKVFYFACSRHPIFVRFLFAKSWSIKRWSTQAKFLQWK